MNIDKVNCLHALNDICSREFNYREEAIGRGIVICGGGIKYFTCAWVCINMLRHVGCALPIELWYLGADELNAEMSRFLLPFGVKCVDGREMCKKHPSRILNGWELKSYAIIHSAFREVLLLDADNVPVIDPSFLFESPEYKEMGAIFWPDFGRLGRDRSIWSLSGVQYRDEPEFETGQIVVDKARCWKALQITMWMNEYSDFWYQHIHGDKETFHIAWRKIGQDYAMPARGIQRLKGTMCQHDFQGRRIFQHRNLAKWTLHENRHVPGFEHERECMKFIDTLRTQESVLLGVPIFDSSNSEFLSGKRKLYRRVGHDERAMTFEPGGIISEGTARLEKYWRISKQNDQITLDIYGEDGLTATLHPEDLHAQLWKGEWRIHEKMPIELRPV